MKGLDCWACLKTAFILQTFFLNIYFSGIEETAATEIAQPEVGIKITHDMMGRNGPPLSTVGVGQTVHLHIWVDQSSASELSFFTRNK